MTLGWLASFQRSAGFLLLLFGVFVFSCRFFRCTGAPKSVTAVTVAGLVRWQGLVIKGIVFVVRRQYGSVVYLDRILWLLEGTLFLFLPRVVS